MSRERRQETIDRLMSSRTRVDHVHIEGVVRTKDGVLNQIVRQLFTNQSFDQLMVRIHEVRDRLNSLGAFSAVNVTVDTSRDSDDGLEVTYHVTESNRITGGVSTTIGNQNDAALVVQLRAPSTCGAGEQVSLELQYGNQSTKGFNLCFDKPLKPWETSPAPRISVAAFQVGYDAAWSGYREIDRGLQADLSFKTGARGQILHNLRWENVWRELGLMRNTGVAFAVREETGHSLKSALKYSMTGDWRDSPSIPSSGGLFRLSHEIAGPLGLGNVAFHKHELEAQYNFPLFRRLLKKEVLADDETGFWRRVSLQAGFRGGFMRSNSPDVSSMVCICDRFFLGGPLTLRGFTINGVGQQTQEMPSATGALAYWLGGAHLYTPLPFLRPGAITNLFRTHGFVNVGNLGNFTLSGDPTRDLAGLTRTTRLSAGFGLVMSLGRIARFEMNYCIPLQYVHGADKLQPGLQFGLGINFT